MPTADDEAWTVAAVMVSRCRLSCVFGLPLGRKSEPTDFPDQPVDELAVRAKQPGIVGARLATRGRGRFGGDAKHCESCRLHEHGNRVIRQHYGPDSENCVYRQKAYVSHDGLDFRC